MRRSTPEEAAADPLNHACTAQGYWHYGPAERLPLGSVGRTPALPVVGRPPDGSLHLLRAPQGGEPLTFKWLSDHEAWGVHPPGFKGRRMAFAPAYLGSQGWNYIGPVPAGPETRAPRARKEKT
jgi:hypothetical protein